jgi:hypothetical protein
MYVNYLVCAQSAIIEQGTNNLTIINIIDQIGSPVFPVGIMLCVVGQLSRKKNEKENLSMRLVITIDGQKPPLTDEVLTLSFQEKLSTRIIAKMQPLIIPRPGKLVAQIVQKKRTFGSWTIQVDKIGDELLSLPTGSTPKVVDKGPALGKTSNKSKSKK